MARQPILDREQNTYAYELLFRSGPESLFRASDPDDATRSTIDFSLLFGSAALTSGLPAFINCTGNILRQDVITLLPRERVVIEILEGVTADAGTIAACERLRLAGYLIALDDYVATADTLRLLPLADIVKVDVLATDATRQAALATEMHQRGIKLVAEKVETRAQFDFLLRLGYDYFQGYYFCKPQTLTMRDIPCASLAYLQVLNVVHRDDYDTRQLERAIVREPSLCYRLLRYLNSAAFGLLPVRSIRHALSLLGRREIQKWVSIVVAISLAEQRPAELIATALTRARTCEALAQQCGEDSCAAFMVGVVSLMDAILDRPMEGVLAQLPITEDSKQALRGEDSRVGALLKLAVCCERGEWENLAAIAAVRGLAEETIWESYREACRWSSLVLQENLKQE